MLELAKRCVPGWGGVCSRGGEVWSAWGGGLAISGGGGGGVAAPRLRLLLRPPPPHQNPPPPWAPKTPAGATRRPKIQPSHPTARQPAAPYPNRLPTPRVIRRLNSHSDVMRMTLLQPSRSNLHELSPLQVRNRLRPRLTHSRPQTPHQLVNNLIHRPPERHPPLDPLGHQLVLGQHIVLEVPILGVGLPLPPPLHGAQ